MLILEKLSDESQHDHQPGAYHQLDKFEPTKNLPSPQKKSSHQLLVPDSPETKITVERLPDSKVFSFVPPNATVTEETYQQAPAFTAQRVRLQPSNVEKDPMSGAYKPREMQEIAEMKAIADHRIEAIKVNYFKKREQQMSLLRVEMRNKKLREMEKWRSEAESKYVNEFEMLAS